MLQANHPWSVVLGAILALGAVSSVWPLGAAGSESGAAAKDSDAAASESDAARSGQIVAGAWQHHKVKFDYVGFTALFTCDGLEDHVRQVLLHIGARKDVRVTANGCPGPIGAPSRTAWVTADFYTLAPAADAGRADTVKARWTPLEVTPRRPNFMGDGDCELIQEMKDAITQNFSLRDVEYRTSCYPRELSIDSFSIKGQALRALSPTLSASTG
jgi:hypothetical protein